MQKSSRTANNFIFGGGGWRAASAKEVLLNLSRFSEIKIFPITKNSKKPFVGLENKKIVALMDAIPMFSRKIYRNFCRDEEIISKIHTSTISTLMFIFSRKNLRE